MLLSHLRPVYCKGCIYLVIVRRVVFQQEKNPKMLKFQILASLLIWSTLTLLSARTEEPLPTGMYSSYTFCHSFDQSVLMFGVVCWCWSLDVKWKDLMNGSVNVRSIYYFQKRKWEARLVARQTSINELYKKVVWWAKQSGLWIREGTWWQSTSSCFITIADTEIEK